MYTHKDQRKAAYYTRHHLRRKRLGLREGRFAGGKNLKQYWDEKRRKTDDSKFLMRIDDDRASHSVIMCMENNGPGRSRRGDADIFSRSSPVPIHQQLHRSHSLQKLTLRNLPIYCDRDSRRKISRKTCVAYWALGCVHEKTMPGATFFFSFFSLMLYFFVPFFLAFSLLYYIHVVAYPVALHFFFHFYAFSSSSVCDLWGFSPEFWPSPLSFNQCTVILLGHFLSAIRALYLRLFRLLHVDLR